VTAVAGRDPAMRNAPGRSSEARDPDRCVRAGIDSGHCVHPTPDGAIKSTCEAIAAGRGFRPGMLVGICRALIPLSFCDRHARQGAPRVLHPLQWSEHGTGSEEHPLSYFRIEAARSGGSCA